MKDDLIDRIYECAVLPDLWPGVLDELASLMQGKGGVLFAMRDKDLKWVSSPTLDDVFRAYVQCQRGGHPVPVSLVWPRVA